MKKKLISSLFFACLFLSSTSLTMAYLTDQKEAVNEISPTENQIRIEESFDPPDELKPGITIPKSPRLFNESEIPVYVRMSVHFSDSAAEAFCEPLSIKNGWSRHSDGYYYYVHPLASKERSEALFDAVKIKDSISSKDLIPFELLVYAESVQAEGFASAEEAWDYYTGGRE